MKLNYLFLCLLISAGVMASANVHASGIVKIGSVIKSGGKFVVRHVAEGFLNSAGSKLGEKAAEGFVESIANKRVPTGAPETNDKYVIPVGYGTHYDYRNNGVYDIYLNNDRVNKEVEYYVNLIDNMANAQIQQWQNGLNIIMKQAFPKYVAPDRSHLSSQYQTYWWITDEFSSCKDFSGLLKEQILGDGKLERIVHDPVWLDNTLSNYTHTLSGIRSMFDCKSKKLDGDYGNGNVYTLNDCEGKKGVIFIYLASSLDSCNKFIKSRNNNQRTWNIR